MNQQPKDQEHGTAQSYVIGFVISLILTLIPYYLVIHKTITGNTLLAVILAFAFTQLIIQLTFFLHLGRGPKPKWNLYFFASTGLIVLFVVIGSIVIINNLHYNMQPSDQVKKIINDEGIYQVNGELTGACQGQYANHQIIITAGKATPAHTDAKKCDTLTFVSADGQTRTINFGVYPQRLSYAGETELSIRKSENQTITLSETGTYQFHDQSTAAISGDFTVSQ